MKFMKYPLILIAVAVIAAVFFWDDIKSIYKKLSNKMQVQFKSNKNNPFNIKANAANKWNGKTTVARARFESFDTLENGVRAGIKTLKTYFEKYKVNTVQGIISRFAPSSENNTASYIDFVSERVGVLPNDKMTFDKETIWKLSAAICAMENGYKLDKSVYETAWKLV